MGGAPGAGVPPSGQGAAEAHWRGGVSNTHFSYVMGDEGVEKFVVTPEFTIENQIGGNHPAARSGYGHLVLAVLDEKQGLYRIECDRKDPGSGVNVLNRPAPPPFIGEVSECEQCNLYARAKELVTDHRIPEHMNSLFNCCRLTLHEVAVPSLVPYFTWHYAALYWKRALRAWR